MACDDFCAAGGLRIMPSKQQRRQKALKEKLREEATAKKSAKEAAEQAAKAAKQGIGHSTAWSPSTMPAPAPMPRPSIQGAMLSFFVVLLYRMYVFAQSLPPLLVNKSRHASAESEIFFKRGSVPFRDATGRPQGRSERRKTADRVRSALRPSGCASVLGACI